MVPKGSSGFFLLFAAVFAGWTVCGVALHSFIVQRNNAEQVASSSNQLMRRVERAIDYTVMAGTEFLLSGHGACTDDAQDFLRRIVLETATISDIYLVSAQQTCSAYGDLSAELPDVALRESWLEARNPEYRIGRLALGSNGNYGVSRGLGRDLELVFAVNSDAALFDVLPNGLRDHGQINLLVGDTPLARFAGAAFAPDQSTATKAFSSSGNRYPLSVEIEVMSAAVSAWQNEISPTLAGVWGLLGVLASGSLSFACIRRRNTDLAEVVRALTNNEIVPYFQPIVDSFSGQIVGCEVLARWVRPDGTVAPPDSFIPLVERHELDDELLNAMVEQTASSLRALISDQPTFYVSFNVSPKQLERDGFADAVTSLVGKQMLPPSQVCFEITERQVIAAPETAARTTRQLSAAGFLISIDDAGTGHNGLAVIQELQVGTIKIDKFFVDHIGDDPRSRVMVDMFVSVAARYGMTTVAEGVETEEQLVALRIAGVDFLQGFFFSEAVDGDMFIERLRANHKHVENTERAQQQVGMLPSAPDAAKKLNPDASPSLADKHETERLEALYRYSILDTPEEETFNRITRIVADALDAPMAAIALIDKERRWFKAVSGGQRGDLPRQQSFCNRTIKSAQPTVVEDTLADASFRDNPLVVNVPKIRAYLGVPLSTPDGYRIGSLCCVDAVPRTFSDSQISLMEDLSAIVMEQLELRTLAAFDSLTSALSRHSFQSEVTAGLADAQSANAPYSFLMIDIDHFKKINDNYGHKVGDDVLAGFVDRVTAAIGPDHTIGRLGGEEFAVSLKGKSAQEAHQMGEAIRVAFAERPFTTHRGALPVTVSVGVSTADGLQDDVESLIHRADCALYLAKGQGRNRVTAFSA